MVPIVLKHAVALGRVAVTLSLVSAFVNQALRASYVTHPVPEDILDKTARADASAVHGPYVIRYQVAATVPLDFMDSFANVNAKVAFTVEIVLHRKSFCSLLFMRSSTEFVCVETW